MIKRPVIVVCKIDFTGLYGYVYRLSLRACKRVILIYQFEFERCGVAAGIDNLVFAEYNFHAYYLLVVIACNDNITLMVGIVKFKLVLGLVEINAVYAIIFTRNSYSSRNIFRRIVMVNVARFCNCSSYGISTGVGHGAYRTAVFGIHISNGNSVCVFKLYVVHHIGFICKSVFCLFETVCVEIPIHLLDYDCRAPRFSGIIIIIIADASKRSSYSVYTRVSGNFTCVKRRTVLYIGISYFCIRRHTADYYRMGFAVIIKLVLGLLKIQSREIGFNCKRCAVFAFAFKRIRVIVIYAVRTYIRIHSVDADVLLLVIAELIFAVICRFRGINNFGFYTVKPRRELARYGNAVRLSVILDCVIFKRYTAQIIFCFVNSNCLFSYNLNSARTSVAKAVIFGVLQGNCSLYGIRTRIDNGGYRTAGLV